MKEGQFYHVFLSSKETCKTGNGRCQSRPAKFRFLHVQQHGRMQAMLDEGSFTDRGAARDVESTTPWNLDQV
jgi:hypothetical protein